MYYNSLLVIIDYSNTLTYNRAIIDYGNTLTYNKTIIVYSNSYINLQ
jgi:hypothetical protein